MEPDLVARAEAATKVSAADLGLVADDVVVMHNSNKLALRLSPCDVFARVALIGRHVGALEIDIAQGTARHAGRTGLHRPRNLPNIDVEGHDAVPDVDLRDATRGVPTEPTSRPIPSTAGRGSGVDARLIPAGGDALLHRPDGRTPLAEAVDTIGGFLEEHLA